MLTDAKIKAARPKDKPYKLGDSGQLYLLVTTSGGRLWRMNYAHGTNDKGRPAQKTLAIGNYPTLTLVDARKRRDEAKALLRDGRDPAVERRVAAKTRAQSDANTFRVVFERWFELNSGWSLAKLRAYAAEHGGKWSHRTSRHWEVARGKWSAIHAADVFTSVENDLLPDIGDLPIGAIAAPKLLDVLQQVECRGAIETAHRLRQRTSAIFVYGIAAGICSADPAASLGKALRDKPRAKKQPSIIDGIHDQDERLKVVRKLLADCDAERCRAGTKLALRLIALTAVRPGELRFASWSEIEGIDFADPTAPVTAALWRIPGERMKGDEDRKAEEFGDHLVPLAPAAVDVLRAAWQLSGGLPYIFPGERHLHRPISENTLNALLKRAGYHGRHVPHGFRAAFSTYMNERADREWRAAGHKEASPDRAIIDLMLAHVPEGTSGSESAYNRAAYMPRRRELAEEWAELIVAELTASAEHLGKPIRYAATGPGPSR